MRYLLMNKNIKKQTFALLSIGILAVVIYLVIENFNNSENGQFSKFNKASIEQKLKNGDIIFQTSRSDQSKAIQLATNSKYSHMGIIYKNNGQFFVFEAVQPVKMTPFENWVKRGENEHYVVKRLKNADQVLDNSTLLKMKQIGEKFYGKSYDIYFEWSDDKIYCSELVWKIYKQATNIEIGKLEKLSDFNLKNEVVKSKLRERYGSKIPLEEKVISPAQMFNSDKLVTVMAY